MYSAIFLIKIFENYFKRFFNVSFTTPRSLLFPPHRRVLRSNAGKHTVSFLWLFRLFVLFFLYKFSTIFFLLFVISRSKWRYGFYNAAVTYDTVMTVCGPPRDGSSKPGHLRTERRVRTCTGDQAPHTVRTRRAHARSKPVGRRGERSARVSSSGRRRRPSRRLYECDYSSA